jgi:hypothetical protein
MKKVAVSLLSLTVSVSAFASGSLAQIPTLEAQLQRVLANTFVESADGATTVLLKEFSPSTEGNFVLKEQLTKWNWK